MPDSPPQHPGRDLLVAFGLGKLEPDEATSVGAHLEECDECCETLLDLKEDTFVGLVRQTREPLGLSPATSTESPDGRPDDESIDATIVLPSGSAPGDAALPSELAEHPRYRIVELIGRGGMGDVYRAEHRLMSRSVALKVINQELVRNAQAVERFRREVQAAARLTHPNIVTAHDAEQAGDVHYLVMEYVDGTDLSEVVKQQGPLDVSQACDYIAQAANGLQHAHEQGMVHRDVKPHNLMVTREGQVKILDFGLATLARDPGYGIQDEETAPASGGRQSPDDPESPASPDPARDARSPNPESRHLTTAGTMMGTPDFISPEQAGDARSVDIRSDVYSLGCTLYYLLTGRPPFDEGSVMDRVKAHAESETTPIQSVRVDVPDELAEVIRRMMAKDPAERFQSPTEVADALAPFVDDHRTLPAVESPATQSTSWSGLDRFAIGVTLFTLCCLMFATQGLLGLRELGFVWPVAICIAWAFTTWWGEPIGRQTLKGWIAWGATTIALAGTVIYVQTDVGTVRVTVSDPQTDVILLADDSFEIRNGDETVTVRPGPTRLQIRHGDLEFETGTIHVKRGQHFDVKVEIVNGKVLARVSDSVIGQRTITAGRSGPPSSEDLARAGIPTEVALQTREGFYVRAIDGEDLRAETKDIGPGERLVAEWLDAGQTRVRLRTAGGNYLHPSLSGDRVSADRPNPGSSEVFEVEWQDRQALRLRLRTRYGNYLHPLAGGGSGVDAAIRDPGSSEVFTLVPLVPEPDNYALQFDGGGNAVSLPIRYDGSHPITLECTVLLKEQTNHGEMLITDTHDSGILLDINPRKHQLGFALRSVRQDQPEVFSDQTFPYGQSVHVAGVFNGRDLRLFLDGKLVKTAPVPEDFLFEQSPMRLTIGANPDGQEYFRESPIGLIDEVRISKLARYAEDFTPANRFEPDEDTWALYHFDEGSGTIARDSSGNDLHGEVFGAKWVRWPSTPQRRPQQAASPETRIKLADLLAAARGATSDLEWETVMKEHAPSLAQKGRGLVELLANLPDAVHEDLIHAGYLKWQYASLDEPRQQAIETFMKAAIGSAQQLGFPEGLENQVPRMLATADVGFAVLDLPDVGGQAVVWYQLRPNSSIPTKFTILHTARPKNARAANKALERQLIDLEGKPYSDVTSLRQTTRETTNVRPESAGERGDVSPPIGPSQISQLRQLEGHSDVVQMVAFASQRLVSAGAGHIVVWDTATGRILRQIQTDRLNTRALAVSPDGTRIVTAGHDGFANVFDVASGEHRLRFNEHSKGQGQIEYIAWSPQARLIASKSWDAEFYTPEDGNARLLLWEADTGHVVRELAQAKGAQMLAFSPNGERLAAGDMDASPNVWDVASGELLFELEGHADKVKAIAFSPDGESIATGSADGSLQIWSAANGEAVKVLHQGGAEIGSLAFLPDGRLVAGSTTQLWVYDVESGAVLAHREGVRLGEKLALAVSADGKQIATAETIAHIEQEPTGRSTIELWSPPPPVDVKGARRAGDRGDVSSPMITIQEPPQSPDEVLDQYLGTWEMELTENPTPQFTRQITSRHTLKTERMLAGRMQLSHMTAESGDEQWLIVRAFDETRQMYRVFLFGSPGVAFERTCRWDPPGRAMRHTLVPPVPGVTGTATEVFLDPRLMQSTLRIKNRDGQLTRNVDGIGRRLSPRAVVDVHASRTPADAVPELQELQPHVGQWDVHCTMRPCVLHPNGFTEERTETGDWILGGQFLRGRSYRANGNLGALYLMTWQPHEKSHRVWHFELDGSIGQWRVRWNEQERTFDWQALDTPPDWIGTLGSVRLVNDDTSVMTIKIEGQQGRVMMDYEQRRERVKDR